MIAAAALLVASCSGAGSPAGSSSTASPHQRATAAPSASAVVDPGSAAPSVPANAIVVHVRDFSLDPKVIRASGAIVTVDVINDGPTVHNITVRDASGRALFATKDLRAGEQQVVVATLPATGTYTTFCSLPGHESLGIKGSLVIR